jgi:ABC-type dipeptide/oligopeptide/nickel transport system permease subunit
MDRPADSATLQRVQPDADVRRLPQPARRRLSPRVLRAYPQLTIGLVFLTTLALASIFAPLIAPYGPTQVDTSATLQTPSADHWFGTDTLGRDTFTRILYGGRLSLFVATASVLLGMLVGVTLGLLSGYRLGWVDSIVMRVMDGLLAFPGLVLALTIAFALGPSVGSVIVALSVVRIPGVARLTRGQVLALHSHEFIQAAAAIGARPTRIVVHHYLPNLVSILLIQATLGAGSTIFAEASLGFLGLGVPPPAPSWGGMLHDGYVFLEINPWQSLIPGAFIFLAVLSFNFIGDGLRDVLDPQQRRRRGA